MPQKPAPKKIETKTDLGVPIAKGKIIIASDPKQNLPTQPIKKK